MSSPVEREGDGARGPGAMDVRAVESCAARIFDPARNEDSPDRHEAFRIHTVVPEQDRRQRRGVALRDGPQVVTGDHHMGRADGSRCIGCRREAGFRAIRAPSARCRGRRLERAGTRWRFDQDRSQDSPRDRGPRRGRHRTHAVARARPGTPLRRQGWPCQRRARTGGRRETEEARRSSSEGRGQRTALGEAGVRGKAARESGPETGPSVSPRFAHVPETGRRSSQE